MNEEQIAAVRRFNRAVSLRIGTLGDSFLDLGRPFGEARLLYEIGEAGADVRDLRARLGLDSGYMSRLLRALERQGLTKTARGRKDARVRRISLTAKGRRAFADVDRVGDDFAVKVLQPLSDDERRRLIAAMSEVEGLMRAFAVRIDAEPIASADATWCLEQYFCEIARRFEAGFDPAQGLPAGVEELTPPKGIFLVARLDGRPVGCGATIVEAGGFGHVRRMWVAEAVRGLGVGRRLLGALEEKALGMGLRAVRLETNKVLKEAQNLYRTAGYREVAPFSTEHYAHHWFEKAL